MMHLCNISGHPWSEWLLSSDVPTLSDQFSFIWIINLDMYDKMKDWFLDRKTITLCFGRSLMEHFEVSAWITKMELVRIHQDGLEVEVCFELVNSVIPGR